MHRYHDAVCHSLLLTPAAGIVTMQGLTAQEAEILFLCHCIGPHKSNKPILVETWYGLQHLHDQGDGGRCLVA